MWTWPLFIDRKVSFSTCSILARFLMAFSVFRLEFKSVERKKKGEKKKKEVVIKLGQPLPNHGACAHSKTSKRWVLFNCCSQPHPCDQCHNDKSEHPAAEPIKMICGFCSREQNYSDESCWACGGDVTGVRTVRNKILKQNNKDQYSKIIHNNKSTSNKRPNPLSPRSGNSTLVVNPSIFSDEDDDPNYSPPLSTASSHQSYPTSPRTEYSEKGGKYNQPNNQNKYNNNPNNKYNNNSNGNNNNNYNNRGASGGNRYQNRKKPAERNRGYSNGEDPWD
eukprot:TRINITY_DN3947_c0_g1_i1.p1 TRINITY_DN3947_c0_g1~~TRINITY_DN3947_c0_g1_i1.p1  ORF type:complete len:278 (-),score=39.70 TRINITY_DN3947_c0_g1_i1:183-1016(-)